MNLSRLFMLLMALGLDAKSFTITDILGRILRFMPLFIERFHMLEQGPPNTGKSFISKLFPNDFEMVTSLTTAKIFGSTSGKSGYVSNTNKAIFFDEISNLTQSDIPSDLRSAFKSYLNGDNFSRGEKDNLESTTSCYFAGNTLDKVQDDLDKSPTTYNKDIFNNIPDFFLENAMIERLIWNPGWLFKKTDESNLSNEDSEPHLKSLIEFIQKNRCSENTTIKIPFTNSTRDCRKARKIITGFIVALFDNNFSSENIDELMEFSKFIIELSYGKYSKFWNTHSGKKFLLNFLPLYLPKDSTIKRIFFSEDRILVVTKENPNKIYKIALNKYGIAENENEIKIYNSGNELSKLIAYVEKYDSASITIIQDFYEFLDLKDEFKHISLNPIEAEIFTLKEEVKRLKDSQCVLNDFTAQLILKYNYLLDFIFSSNNGFPKQLPEKIILSNNNFEDLNFKNFKNEVQLLNVPFNDTQVGHKNGEYKIMNFSHLVQQ